MNGPFDRKRTPSTAASPPVRSPAPDARTRLEHGRPSTSTVSRSEEDEARSSSKYRAALEALFAPKTTPATPPPAVAERPAKKVVSVPNREDPRGPERQKRLGKLLAAEGRAAVTKAADDFTNAGFELPDEQEVMLKLLDHSRDDRICAALTALVRLLGEEPVQRRTVLEARLRRLEEHGDDAEVRALATSLRKQLSPRQGR
jgi:hypothetical protein